MKDFAATKTATQQNSKNRVVPFASKVRIAGCREQSFTLVSGQPIPKAQANPSPSFHATDAGGEFRTEQPGVCRFVSHTSDSGKTEIYRRRSQVALLKVDPVPKDNSTVECQTRF
jgi:hypothetical protein